MPDVIARRLGSGRWHFASVHPRSLVEGEHWGAPCVLIVSPIVAKCGAVLRGTVFASDLDHGQGVNVNCRPCAFVERDA